MIAQIRDLSAEPEMPAPGLRRIGELLPQVLARYDIVAPVEPNSNSASRRMAKSATGDRNPGKVGDWKVRNRQIQPQLRVPHVELEYTP